MGGSSSSLHEAVREGNVKKLQRVLRRGRGRSWVNECDAEYDEPPLLRALRCGHGADTEVQLARLLLQHRADPNAACTVRIPGQAGRPAITYDWTPMHEAARKSGVEVMALLLAHGGDPHVHRRTRRGRHHRPLLPVLHVSAWRGNTDTVQALLDAGCDVNELDFCCESALVIPISQGDTEMVQLLLNAGCKLNSRAWGHLRKLFVGECYGASQHSFSGAGAYSLLSLCVLNAWPHLAILLLQHGYSGGPCELYALVKALQFSGHSLGSTGARQLITCYLNAGHVPRPGDSQLMDNLQLPPNHGFSTEPIAWIKSQLRFPSLQQLCRNAIRRALCKLTGHASIMARLLGLADVLPLSLVHYLTLEQYTMHDHPAYRPLTMY